MSIQPTGGRTPGSFVLRAAVLATLLTFGCTTVRAPVSGIAPSAPVHGPTAEPQVELWLESGRNVTPAESALAESQARDALRRAVEGRTLGTEDVLVVRAQAVSRTRSHRNDQRAAVAGIVVGAVAIVAVAVVALASGKGSPRIGAPRLRGSAGATARPAPSIARAVAPARPLPIPRAFPARGTPRAVAAPSGSHGPDVALDVEVVVAAPDAAPAAGPGEWDRSEPAPAWAYAPPPAAAVERISTVTLPPPEPLRVERRGFFDGDWVRLELLVVDARSGVVRWAKTVSHDVDVRDAPRLREVVDRALAELPGWYAPDGAVAYE